MSEPPPSEFRQMILAAMNGDRGAFDVLFGLAWKPAYWAAYRVLKDRDRAEDVAQDCCLRVFLNLHDLAGNVSDQHHFLNWVHRVALRRAIDDLRRSGRFVRQGIEPVEPPLDPVSDRNVTTLALKECMKRLSADQRAAFVLWSEGYTEKEIAAALARPVATTRNWVYRGLQGLRDCLDQPATAPLESHLKESSPLKRVEDGLSDGT